MPTDEATVASLQSHIRELEQEIIDTKKMVNRLLVRRGQPSLYSEASLDGEVGNVFAIRSDQFYGRPLATAIREYLKMRQVANLGAATVNEIYDALCRGGFSYESENEDNRKRNLRISLTKNSSLFHRLSNGTHFGLPEWYETVPKGEDEAQSKAKKSKKRPKSKDKKRKAEAKEQSDANHDDDQATETPLPAEKNGNGKTTVIKALREGIQAMTGDFTKQQVVDWIEKHHPALKAQDRKTSIFSMMANLKGDLKLVTTKKGKGTEPHRFRRADDVNHKEAASMN